MSNIKFNKTIVASMVSLALLSACTDDTIEPAAVTVTPTPPAEVTIIQDETTTVYVSVVDGNTKQGIAGLTVEFHIDGQVITAQANGAGYKVADLPDNSDFIVVVSGTGKATTYAVGITDRASLNLPQIEIFAAKDSVVTLADVTGTPVSGLSLYISGSELAGINAAPASILAEGDAVAVTSIPDNYAVNNGDGTYTFSLPDNGETYQVEAAGPVVDDAGNELELVGMDAIDVSAGQNPIVYADYADEATMFTLTFGLTYPDGSPVTNGPASASLNSGDFTATWHADSAMYVVDGLSAEDAMAVFTLDMLNINGLEFTATDAAATGLASFTDGIASVTIALAMNTELEAGETVLPIEYTVSHAAATAGTSATATIVFNQPVEIFGDVTSTSERLEDVTTNSNASKNFTFTDANGGEVFSVETIAGEYRAYITSATNADDINEATINWKKDDLTSTSITESAATFFTYRADSPSAILVKDKDWGIKYEYQTLRGDDATNALLASGEGAEVSWNDTNTVLTITLNDDSYDLAAETPVLPTGYATLADVPATYFNATDLQHGKAWQLSLIVKPLTGSADPIDVSAFTSIPNMAAKTANATNIILASGTGVSMADSVVTNAASFLGDVTHLFVDWSEYAGQTNWVDASFNNIALASTTGLTAQYRYNRVEMDEEFIGSRWPTQFTDGTFASVLFLSTANCRYNIQQQITDYNTYAGGDTIDGSKVTFIATAWANFMGNPITDGSQTQFDDITDGYCEVGEVGGNLLTVSLQLLDLPNNVELAAKLAEPPTDGFNNNAFIVSPEALTGSIEIVSFTEQYWDATADNDTGAVATHDVQFNKLIGVGLDGSASYDNITGTQYYIMDVAENAVIDNKDTVNFAYDGDMYGAKILTGFPASVTGLNYVYSLTELISDDAGAGGGISIGQMSTHPTLRDWTNVQGLITHITVNATFTTASGEVITLDNVKMPIQ